ncbi:hypothetical protein SAMN05660337_0816 [Maridesulfovibrio ferrireducens]|uniref:Uncharacterized protein n=1 Tax=Maridesulfovibrio ferrireducens TaxID=246191 RepID=A0A1G9CWY2_9BACT|nr:hypothetical protein [Maridesulfovibrio ferrireducens]SDK55915.1 hypothetical protein SAMN05660337_0816 [Maridesulfovibrio ferrireducens]
MDKRDHNKLFNEYELASMLENNINSIKSQVDAIKGKNFLNTPADKIIARLVMKNSLNQLKLYEHLIQAHCPIKCKIDVSDDSLRFTDGRNRQSFIDGIKVRIEIPFSGDERLWQLQPSVFHVGGGPAFRVKKGRIVKDYIHPQHADHDQVKSEFLQNLSEIKKYLHWQDMDIQRYKEAIRETAEEAVAERRAKLQKLEMLRKRPIINMKHRDRSADFSPINVRKKLCCLLGNRNDIKPEPCITENDFINIIKVIRHTGCSCERTPRVFRVHNENELRDIIISTLNTQFEGNTENDIFMKEGKTSISISKNGKSVFVGICKIWSCKKRFMETINQLLNCESWQDCKTTLIIFNKNQKEFAEVLNLAMQMIKTHPNFISFDNEFDENEWHFTMQATNNKSCRISMRVMIFNLYAEETKPCLRLTKQEMDFFRPDTTAPHRS